MRTSITSTESRVVRLWAGLAGDLRIAARRLWKEPGFTGIALLTLALCIGANTAVFSLVYSMILKPLPFPEAGRIVAIFNDFPKSGLTRFPSNLTQYADFKANTSCFDSVALCSMQTVMMGAAGSPQRVVTATCTPDIFEVLGVKPLLGRFFTVENSRKGEEDVIVLTETFWKSHFNEDPGVLGRTIRLDEATYHIVGVAPKSLEVLDATARLLRPISWDPKSIDPNMRYACSLPLFARLKPGVTEGRALAEITGIEKRFYDSAVPAFRNFLDQTGHRMSLGSLQVERVRPIKSSLLLLEGGVVFVLLIGCVNVANLLLTRANGQLGDLAIRAALGAGHGAIARQLLVESLLLTLLGASIGIGLSYGTVQGINHYMARLLPNMPPVSIDRSVLFYAIGTSGAVGLLIGLLPVVHILRSSLAEVIHRSSRSASGGRGVRALSSILVTGQVAVALVLLSGAGLLIRSFANAISVDPGFEPRNLVVGSVALPSAYQDKAKSAALQRRLVQGLNEIPGVEGAALATGIPFEGGLPVYALTLKDSSLPRDSSQPGAYPIGVSLEYFRTLKIQLLEGRLFDEADIPRGMTTYVVDQNFEKKYFPGRTAVGGHFTFDDPARGWDLIVGVVRNVPHNSVESLNGNPFVYYPLLARPPGGLNFFVRSARPVGDILSAVRDKLGAVDPLIPLLDTKTAQKVIDDSFDYRRAVMLLLGCFAALALFLSSIGIYGVLAYDVSQRRREIGIRGAIGATPRQVMGLVMAQGLWRIGIGLVVGLVSAILLSHTMASLLFEMKPTDPWSYIWVALTLLAVATLATYLPARRAAKIDPIETLRAE